jgi:protein-S-isoprenylcysteine O-methyltransferase Ste14
MSSAAQRWRVPLGFAAAAVLLLAAHPRPLSLALGLPLAACGLALRAAAAGHIRKNDALATSGPYRFTRNPLYLGSAILALGLIAAANVWWLALLALALLAGIYLPVIRQEERFLAARFGPAFDAYAARVPRLLPRWPWPRAAPGSFSVRLYLRHREYQALLGFLAIAAVLVLKWRLAWPW